MREQYNNHLPFSIGGVLAKYSNDAYAYCAYALAAAASFIFICSGLLENLCTDSALYIITSKTYHLSMIRDSLLEVVIKKTQSSTSKECVTLLHSESNIFYSNYISCRWN